MRSKDVKFFKILVAKAYFDKGWSLMNYPKNLLGIIGIGAAFQQFSLMAIAIIGILFGVFCYFLGRYWYNYGLIETENEIQNIFNPFQKQVREKLKIRKV